MASFWRRTSRLLFVRSFNAGRNKKGITNDDLREFPKVAEENWSPFQVQIQERKPNIFPEDESLEKYLGNCCLIESTITMLQRKNLHSAGFVVPEALRLSRDPNDALIARGIELGLVDNVEAGEKDALLARMAQYIKMGLIHPKIISGPFIKMGLIS